MNVKYLNSGDSFELLQLIVFVFSDERSEINAHQLVAVRICF